MKPWWKMTEDEDERCLVNLWWCPGILEYFREGFLFTIPPYLQLFM